MGFLKDMADLLVEAGAGTFGTDVFAGRMPAIVPDETVSVQSYQGLPPRYVHDQASPIDQRPTFQVLVRGASLPAVEAKAYELHAYLASVTHRTVNGTRYLALRMFQDPFELVSDRNDRVQYVFNGYAQLTR